MSHKWELSLLGAWQLKLDHDPVAVGPRQQRVIAALALLGTRSRSSLASLLWPDSTETQSSGNLRASLFHITHELPGLVEAKSDFLALGQDVDVDFHKVRWLIAELQDGVGLTDPGSAQQLCHADLLPCWYDDWVMFEQERLQQLRLDGLEALARHLLKLGETSRATEAALAAASIEPLRESAQLVLLECHLRAGNTVSAMQSFHEFRGRLKRELGVRPSPIFAPLVEAMHTGPGPAPVPPFRSR